MSLQPLGDKLLIKPAPIAEKTAGGIIIPDNAKEKPDRGEVVAISQDKDTTVKPGDTILYAKNAGTPIKEGDIFYLLLKEGDVWCIVK
jgi:chaperonin GroES